MDRRPSDEPSTIHAQIKSWTAAIRKGSLPPFPHEVPDTIPVSIVRIQRVQMQKLIQYVKEAAKHADIMYRNAYVFKLRDTFSDPAFGGNGTRRCCPTQIDCHPTPLGAKLLTLRGQEKRSFLGRVHPTTLQLKNSASRSACILLLI